MIKKIFIAVAAMMAISASAQSTTKKVRVYDGNTVVYERDYNSIDSIVFVDVEEPGILPGDFSVSENTRVHFAKGNLQYQASTDTWRFAEHQYDRIGEDNANLSPTYSGWIDLLAWGTGNNPTIVNMEYQYFQTFVDWGTNAISNGGNEPNLWRTLTADEWVYLIFGRANGTTLFGFGTVNGQTGLILLPDNWVTPQGATFTPSTTLDLVYIGDSVFNNTNNDNFYHNIYTESEWKVMERYGAVFLPCSGVWDIGGIYWVDRASPYWSSTPHPELEGCALTFAFSLGSLSVYGPNNRYEHLSVRLVRVIE